LPQYFRNIYKTVYTILVGMRITLRYFVAKTVTLQYPDVPPVLQPRYRGFHYFEIEKCIACDMCAKACPVDCIYIEKSGPRKIDKASGVAKGGAMQRYAIDYAKCMFCALCVEPCPTDCIHMGNIHDLSGYDRSSMVVEFTELAKEGLKTPQPLWMRQANLPEWAAQTRQHWLESGEPVRDEMIAALSESEVPKPAKKAPAKAPAEAKPKPAPAKQPSEKPETE
jgi:NADH-quinone oxidoreductase subunit I